MDGVIQKFRGALGGFNRRDVARYIEQTAAEHRKRVAGLEEELSRSEARRAELEEELAGLRDEKGNAAAEEARARASLEESTRTLSRLRGELSQTESMLKAARNELTRLEGQVAELEPMAKRYEELKDRVATVELDAHRKAQATVKEAEAQAGAIREEARQWVDQTLERYADLRQGMDSLFACARGVTALEGSAALIDQQAAGLKERAEPAEE